MQYRSSVNGEQILNRVSQRYLHPAWSAYTHERKRELQKLTRSIAKSQASLCSGYIVAYDLAFGIVAIELRCELLGVMCQSERRAVASCKFDKLTEIRHRAYE